MATDSPATYPKIYFHDPSLSKKTIFEITKKSVSIYDPEEGYRHTFPGGTDNYSIIIEDTGTKKYPRKTITIKRLMPLCPLSGYPIIEPEMAYTMGIRDYKKSPDCSFQFQKGFAYNCYQVETYKHYKFDLNPTLYCRFAISARCDIYLVVPIVDRRHMQPDMIDALYDGLGNMDVVKIIAKYYYEENKQNFNFHMANTPIKPNTLYHKRALIDLFLKGNLKLGIINNNLFGQYGYFGHILILEPNAYNHVSPYGKESYLKNLFITCQEMMNFRMKIIEMYLV